MVTNNLREVYRLHFRPEASRKDYPGGTDLWKIWFQSPPMKVTDVSFANLIPKDGCPTGQTEQTWSILGVCFSMAWDLQRLSTRWRCWHFCWRRRNLFFFSESTLISVAVSPQLPCFPGAQSDSSEAEVLLEMEAGFLHGFSVGGYLEKTPANRVSVGDLCWKAPNLKNSPTHRKAATAPLMSLCFFLFNIA